MHILLLVDYFSPHIWGIEQLFGDLAQVLLDHHCRVTVLTSRHDQSLPFYEQQDNLTIYRIGTGRKDLPWYAVRFALRQNHLFGTIDHIHTTTFSACIPARLIAWWYRKTVTITIHELYQSLWYTLKWWRWRWYILFERFILSLSRDHIIVPSEYTRQSLLTLRPHIDRTLSVIYNQIDHQFRWYTPSDSTPSVAPSLIYSGRLGKEKGIDMVINSLPSILTQFPSLKVHCVVSFVHPRYQEIVSMIERLNLTHAVIWHDATVDKWQLRDLYLQATIGLVPSMSEWFCYTAVEMQLLGLPLVATNCGALPEVLDHTRTLFVPFGDIKGFSDAIETQLTKSHASSTIAFQDTLVGYYYCFLELSKSHSSVTKSGHQKID